jgi:hypothetical protein
MPREICLLGTFAGIDLPLRTTIYQHADTWAFLSFLRFSEAN